MTLGADVGVVLRGRRGRNIIVQSNSIDLKVVAQASQHVADILEVDPASSLYPEPSESGLGQQGPALACGQLKVLNSRFTAVYRVVNQVLVIVVSRPASNVFTSINLAAAITRLLIAELKSPTEVMPERVEKKYPQVYLGIDSLLRRGTFDVEGALVDSMMACEAMTVEWALRARRGKGAAGGPDQQRATAAPSNKNKRRLSSQSEQLNKMKFNAPADLMAIAIPESEFGPQQPQQQLVMPRSSFAGPPPTTLPDDAFDFSDLLKTKEQQGLKGPGVTDEELLAALGVKKQEAQQPAGFGFDDAGWGEDPFAASAAEALAAKPPGPQAPLQLDEAWHAEVVGSSIMRAGLVGAVRWTSASARATSGNTPFRLHPPEFPDTTLKQSLRSAQRHEHSAQPATPPGTFLANAVSSIPITSPILRYSLPATYGTPPVLVHLSYSLSVPAGRSEALVLVGLRFNLSLENGLKFGDVVADLVAPALFGSPLRAYPAAQLSKGQRCLRWTVKGLGKGQGQHLAAVYRVKKGRDAALSGLRTLAAIVRVSGALGSTLTGVALQQSPSTMLPMREEPNATSWRAEVVARCRLS